MENPILRLMFIILFVFVIPAVAVFIAGLIVFLAR